MGRESSEFTKVKDSLFEVGGYTRSNNPHLDIIYNEAFKAGKESSDVAIQELHNTLVIQSKEINNKADIIKDRNEQISLLNDTLQELNEYVEELLNKIKPNNHG